MFSRMSIFAMFLLLFASLLCHAQTQTATCTNWKFFNVFSPSGINRWGTVVGSASGPQTGVATAGYVRYSNGATKKYVGPNAAQVTFLARRNAAGVTVGSYVDVNSDYRGLLLSGSSMATLDYPGAPQTILTGINKWYTMVGTYQYNDDADFGPLWTGFKMWKNGSFTPIGGPSGAINTNPTSISDTGIVVGWYVGSDAVPFTPYPNHGFVLANGVYKTLDYPNAFRTSVNDINSAGVIVGSWDGGGFLFVNGKFKNVLGPNGETTAVNGINDYGYVTGTSSAGSFTAHCQ
jgi:hypothetical protein